MTLVDRIDDFGRTGWIAVTVLSFVMFWPVGLVVLGFLYGSGRMGCWNRDNGDRWQRRADRMQRGIDRMQQGMERMQAAAERFRGAWQSQGPRPSGQGASGNRAFDEYRVQSRGGKGIITMKTNEKTGRVVGALTVIDKDEIMLLTQQGQMVRTPVKDIRSAGRNTQGVKLINLTAGDKLTAIARVVSESDEPGDPEAPELTA